MATEAEKQSLIDELEDTFAMMCVEAPMPEALSWTEAQICQYFESGGEDRPPADAAAPPAGFSAAPTAAPIAAVAAPAPSAPPQTAAAALLPLPPLVSDAELKRWFPARTPAPAGSPPPRLRLVCFPNAGSAENVYTGMEGRGAARKPNPFALWASGAGVELAAVQYPGREGRRAETPLASARELAGALLPPLLTVLRGGSAADDGVPFAFVGHSVGTWVQYETMRALRAVGFRAPVLLLLSAFPPPDIAAEQRPWAPDNRRTLLSEASFQQECRQWDVNEVVFDPGMWRAYEPLLRADFALFDTYEHTPPLPPPPPPPLRFAPETELELFCAAQDRRVTESMVRGWARFLAGGAPATAHPVHRVEGNHLFFYQPAARAGWAALVARRVERRLEALATAPPAGAGAGAGSGGRAALLQELSQGVRRWALQVNAVGGQGGWQPGEHEWEFYLSLLPGPEQAAVRRFHFDKDKRLAAGSRLLQRALLSQVLGLPWDRVSIARSKEGKPYAAGVDATRFPNFNFNVSHHGAFVAIASEPAALVGLDLMDVHENAEREKGRRARGMGGAAQAEPGKEAADFVGVFDNNLTPGERNIIAAGCRFGGGAAQQGGAADGTDDLAVYRQFYRVWTLKEAYIKAIGIGLGFELQRADFVMADPGDACGTEAHLKLDGVLQPRWRFRFEGLDGPPYRHVACISRGPPSHGIDGFRAALPCGELDRSMDAGDRAGPLAALLQAGVTFDDLLDLPSPKFQRLAPRDLVPKERLADLDAAIQRDA